MTDSARPGLVAFYDIRPENGAGQLLQPGTCTGLRKISLPRKGILRGVFLGNHLAIADNLTRTTKRQNTYKSQLTINKWP